MPSVRRSIYQVMRASKYQMHLGNRIRQTYDHIPGTPFERHAYVLVEGDKPNRYFFVDATWGSGTVNNGTFACSDDDMSWFHTSPVWMAFSHFPYEEKYQMLKNHYLSKNSKNFPVSYPTWSIWALMEKNC